MFEEFTTLGGRRPIFSAAQDLRSGLLHIRRRRAMIGAMSRDARTTLARLDLFQGLPAAELDALAAAARQRQVAAGRLVYRRGEEYQGLYVVVSGAVETVVEGGSAQLGPGALFGEAALLADGPHVADVRAVEDAALLFLPRRPLDDLFATHPARRLRLRTLSVTRRLSNVSAAFVDDAAASS